MPKKFIGENSKAAEARARKEAKKQEEMVKKQQAAEDEYWRDDDKHVMKKQQRKDEREKKRTEQAEKKQELKKLHDEEMESLKSKTSQPALKLTRVQIESNRQKEEAAAQAADKDEESTMVEAPLIENLNRMAVEGDEARTIDEAIIVLDGSTQKVDLHPEKRMKAAYSKYEEDNLPILKQENPNMRLSQLKQMLKKQWMKSPENPLNQRMATLNAK